MARRKISPYLLEIAMVIHFYTTKGPHGCFSNFSRHPVEMKGKVWPTSEHYYQAQKMVGTEFEEKIRECPNPKAAANMGRDKSLPMRDDWDSVKDDVMRDVVRAKFTQHKDIQNILL